MTPQSPDVPNGADAQSPSAHRRSALSWPARGVTLAILGIVLVTGATLGWFPLGDDPLVRHAPQLAGILMISQGAYWVAKSRSGGDGS
jgi:hypothetical protein